MTIERKGLWVFTILQLLTIIMIVTFLFQRHVHSFWLWLLPFLWAFISYRVVLKDKTGWILLLGTVSLLYLLMEITIYTLICVDTLRPDVASVMGNNFGATDDPYVNYEPATGYRYIPGKTHLVNIQEGQVVYDHQLSINQQGYCSVTDFTYRKTDSTVQRIMVLGDSYSAGEIVDTAWPDVANKQFKANSIKTELYNFGLEGAGLSNWHAIFFKEIVPKYDFDGVALAIFGDVNYYSSDLSRDYIIKYSGIDAGGINSSGMNFFPTLPKDYSDFRKNYEPQLFFDSYIYPEQDLEHYKNRMLHPATTPRHIHFAHFKPYLLHYLTDAIGFIMRYGQFAKRYTKTNISAAAKQNAYANLDDVANYYGPEKWGRLKSILDYCKQNHKSIWLLSIPSTNVAEQDSVNYHNNIYNRQLRCLAGYYGAFYVDGYDIFDGVKPADYEQLHLPIDSHWNRNGIDRFVAVLLKRYQTNRQ